MITLLFSLSLIAAQRIEPTDVYTLTLRHAGRVLLDQSMPFDAFRTASYAIPAPEELMDGNPDTFTVGLQGPRTLDGFAFTPEPMGVLISELRLTVTELQSFERIGMARVQLDMLGLRAHYVPEPSGAVLWLVVAALCLFAWAATREREDD